MSELWLGHYSVCDWREPSRWSTFFQNAQRVLGAPVTHLDENDPIRRKVTSLDDAAAFVCAFKEQEQSRWLFGRFKALGIEFSIDHFRQVQRLPNTFKWHVPESFVERAENRCRLKALFDLGNESFKTFYSYGDDVEQLKKKKKPSGSIDIETELPGVFWMTYFNAAYVAFFGKE